MAQIGACEATAIALNNVIGGQFPRIPKAGMVYALLASQLMNGGTIPNPAEGMNAGFVRRDKTTKKPIVKIRHYQPSTTASSTTKDCDASGMDPVEDEMMISLYRQHSFSIGINEMSALCGDAATVYSSGQAPDGTRFNVQNTPIMEEVRAKAMAVIYKLVADINQDLTTKLGTKFGTNYNTGLSTAKSIALFKADGALNEQGLAQLTNDFDDNNFVGAPIMVGGRRLGEFSTLMKWGCCSNSGTDFEKAAQAGGMYFKDPVADTTFGAGQFAVIAPGMVKLVTWNQYQGFFKKKHGNSYLGSFTLPEFGDAMRFDLKVVEEDCPDEEWKFIISLHYDVYVPKDVYGDGDPHEGVNGLLRYSIA